MMKHEQFLKASDGVDLFLRKDIDDADKAVLVIVHGLGEHSGTMDYMAERLRKSHIGTYRPDHRGHGKSGGERAWLDSFHQLPDDLDLTVQLALKENPHRPVFLYGHSMGGFTVAAYAVKHPGLAIRGIITSAALLEDISNTFKSLEKGMDRHNKIENTFTTQICTVEERVREFRGDPLSVLYNTAGICYELSDGVGWFGRRMSDFDYPVLITHGGDDSIVNPQDSCDFFRKAKSLDKQLKIYGGCHHAIFQEFCRDEVLDDIMEWMLRRAEE